MSVHLGRLTQELLSAEVPKDTDNLEGLLKACRWERTGASVLVASIWRKAVAGDVNSAKLIRDMNGEAAAVYGDHLDFSSLTEEELRSMADFIEEDLNQLEKTESKKRNLEEFDLPW